MYSLVVIKCKSLLLSGADFYFVIITFLLISITLVEMWKT